MSKQRFTWFNVTSLTLGFTFLYLPILIIMIYSFNGSRLVSVWGGFSTKWYTELFKNQAFIDAFWVTLKVAFISSTLATILGTIAAYFLVRSRHFFSKTIFSVMICAPIVMPEVITGLSMLLMFIAIGIERGFMTIIIAHTTFSMCYVSVIVSSKLVNFNWSLEESALDLGSSYFDAFITITLPVIAPSVISGWLFGFILSFDDLVIASFVSGPDSTTLPMKVFSSVKTGLSPEINALSSIMIMFLILCIIIFSLINKKTMKFLYDKA